MTSELLIRINQSGVVRIEVEGQTIALLKSMELKTDSTSPLPELTIEFPKDVNNPSAKELIDKYAKIMEGLPYCKVIRQ